MSRLNDAPLSVRFAQLADEELEQARLWYLNQDARVAHHFSLAVDSAVDRIARLPESWPVHEGVGILPGLRKHHLDKPFRYTIFYRVIDEALAPLTSSRWVRVVAFAPQRREPNYWHDRLH